MLGTKLKIMSPIQPIMKGDQKEVKIVQENFSSIRWL
jgi:hypothetical protein